MTRVRLLKATVSFVVGLLSIPNTVVAVERLAEIRDDAVNAFLATDGAHPEIIDSFRNEAIEALIARTGVSEDQYVRARVRRVVLQYVIAHREQMDPDVVVRAKDVVYAGLSAEDSNERMLCAVIVGQCEGDSGLDRLRPLLRDAAENVRIAAFGQFVTQGNRNRISELEVAAQACAERRGAKEGNADQVLRYTRNALKQLKQRWNDGGASELTTKSSGGSGGVVDVVKKQGGALSREYSPNEDPRTTRNEVLQPQVFDGVSTLGRPGSPVFLRGRPGLSILAVLIPVGIGFKVYFLFRKRRRMRHPTGDEKPR